VPKVFQDFRKIWKNRRIWADLKVLIIDEVSMLSGEFFDIFEQEVCRARNGGQDAPLLEEAFEGLQVILIGDFFQMVPTVENLPRVDMDLLRKTNRAVLLSGSERSRQQGKVVFSTECVLNRGMLFQSDAFWKLRLCEVELEKNYRQEKDHAFKSKLNALREGRDLPETISWLNKHCHRPLPGGGDDAVMLFPTNDKVDRENEGRLRSLPGYERTFKAKDSIRVKQSNSNSEDELTMEEKEHLLKNSAFFKSDSRGCIGSELTLKLGARVMLSANIDSNNGLINGATGIVRRLASHGVQVEFDDLGLHWVNRFEFISCLAGIGTCIRKQMPLRLAWAMTHHRGQGKTLRRVRVDPAAFCDGQSYVALSRATDASGLELLSPLRLHHVRVNMPAKRFKRFTELALRGGSSSSISRARKEIGTWKVIKPRELNYG